ncbi:type II toxin-antitoxin system RelB/DinJ family antitoxin [Mycoplasmatota bacterium WC30]
MAKTAYVNVRVDEDVKTKAERILNELGINTSTAIDMFLKQIILKDGMPFDVRIPRFNNEKHLKELVEAINLPKDGPYPSYIKRIASLYAKREIDLDVAIFAAKKSINTN